MVQTFQEMWADLLEELMYGILDYPAIESVHSLDHWNLVVCEDVPTRCDPQMTQELVKTKSNFDRALLELVNMLTKKHQCRIVKHCKVWYHSRLFCLEY